jgi:hypothetical protein
MSHAIRFTAAALALAIGTLATDASAARVTGVTGTRAAQPATASLTLTPKARGEMTKQFVLRWGGYVQRVYRVPVGTWAKRMVADFASADPANFRAALARDTFEGAMAALNGAGHRFDDEAAITRLAKLPAGAKALPAPAPGATDLVYTPIQPCRILDTRNTAAGAIVADSSRDFVSINQSDYTAQGGSASDCGTLGVHAAAVAINLTAVAPDRGGYATVYPYGTTKPLASSVNYGAGEFVNNGIIVQIPSPLTTSDFTVYSYGTAHYVADIVGYFAPPLATALQCQDTANTIVANVAAGGGTANASAPACPTGYTQTATNCETSSWLMPIVFSHSGTCSARNNDTIPQDLRASRTCCRVPGR